MASATGDLPYKMHVTPDNTGLWRIKQTEEAARKVSELLQVDMEKHHVFFNDDGFHNHIPHHILALYGTGAPPSALQTAYDDNTDYQRPVLPPHTSSTTSSTTTTTAPPTFHPWPSAAAPYLGNETYYPDFLRFFQSEIRSHNGSWQAVLSKYLFSPDQTGDALLMRLFAGLLHPLIQLMYGVEWSQEAVVAEGLAQAAVHEGGVIGEGYLLSAEKLAAAFVSASASLFPSSSSPKGEKIVDLLEAIRADKELVGSIRNEDGNKIRDGVLGRARERMLAIAARVRVAPEEEEVRQKTAEMFDAAVLVAAGAALAKEGEKQPKFDFFLMHHVNSSPFFVTLSQQDWIPVEAKARLLEWKIRMDLLQYVARGSPELSLEKLVNYTPRKPDAGGSPEEIIRRLHTLHEDGHAIKLGRAAVICHDIGKPYEDSDWLKIKGDDVWKKVCHLVVDSVEAPGPRWVRTTGLDEAWKEVPNL